MGRRLIIYVKVQLSRITVDHRQLELTADLQLSLKMILHARNMQYVPNYFTCESTAGVVSYDCCELKLMTFARCAG